MPAEGKQQRRLGVLVAVTHLLGVGHLARAAALARALAAAGHRVTLVSGGRPAPLVRLDDVELVQLPPVHCRGTDFRTLYAEDGGEATQRLLGERVVTLLGALARLRPDVVVTELYPFGRRQLAREFSLLVDAALALRPRPAVLVSIRDILNPPSKPERAEEAAARLAAYDGVMVHGDAALAPLDLSWPVDPPLARRLRYTGYLAGDAAPPSAEAGAARADGQGEILVTGGGSAASMPLYDAALAAARKDAVPGRWRILVGHGVPEPQFRGLVERAGGAAVVERARADFPVLLRRAAVVVAQAGYNTCVDLAQARARVVFVPFEEGNEREQALRAGVWQDRGWASVVPASRLTPERLADAVAGALAAPRPASIPLDCGGDAASVAVVEGAAREAAALDAARERLGQALDEMTARARRLELWWRDDDAVAPGAALDRLLDLARRVAAPLGLAVIPRDATPALADRLEGEPHVRVLQHGFGHADRAPPGARKAELDHAPVGAILDELREGAARLGGLFGARALPVLVPPWNRIGRALVPHLPDAGFRGLSTFKERDTASPAPGLVQVNTHWDPIAWRAGGGLGDRVALLDALTARARAAALGRTDPGNPSGSSPITSCKIRGPGVSWRRR